MGLIDGVFGLVLPLFRRTVFLGNSRKYTVVNIFQFILKCSWALTIAVELAHNLFPKQSGFIVVIEEKSVASSLQIYIITGQGPLVL